MEAPEKIYMTPSFGEPDNVLLASFSKSHLDFHRDIEYIRKDVVDNMLSTAEDHAYFAGSEHIREKFVDAFIERALEWYCLDCECNGTCAKDNHRCFFRQEFKRYLEGDENARPPKVENAINPNGSLKENYIYRHFIRSTKDAFIEKACEWLKENADHYVGHYINDDDTYMDESFIDDFRNCMKGE